MNYFFGSQSSQPDIIETIVKAFPGFFGGISATEKAFGFSYQYFKTPGAVGFTGEWDEGLPPREYFDKYKRKESNNPIIDNFYKGNILLKNVTPQRKKEVIEDYVKKDRVSLEEWFQYDGTPVRIRCKEMRRVLEFPYYDEIRGEKTRVGNTNWMDSETAIVYLGILNEYLVERNFKDGIVILHSLLQDKFSESIPRTRFLKTIFLGTHRNHVLDRGSVKIIIMPYNLMNTHWNCVVLNISEKKIYAYEPIRSQDIDLITKDFIEKIKEHPVFQEIFKDIGEFKVENRFGNQSNYKDCGFHVLDFVTTMCINKDFTCSNALTKILNTSGRIAAFRVFVAKRLEMCRKRIELCAQKNNAQVEKEGLQINDNLGKLRKKFLEVQTQLEKEYTKDRKIVDDIFKISNAENFQKELTDFESSSYVKRGRLEELREQMMEEIAQLPSSKPSTKPSSKPSSEPSTNPSKPSSNPDINKVYVALAFVVKTEENEGLRNRLFWEEWLKNDALSKHISLTVIDEWENGEEELAIDRNKLNKLNVPETVSFDLIRQNKKTYWGGAFYSQCKITRHILNKFPKVTHIVLLSGTCVPLVTPTVLLQELSQDGRSRIALIGSRTLKFPAEKIQANEEIARALGTPGTPGTLGTPGIQEPKQKRGSQRLSQTKRTPQPQEIKIHNHHGNLILSRADAERALLLWPDFEEVILQKLINNEWVPQRHRTNLTADQRVKAQGKFFLGYPDEIVFGTVLAPSYGESLYEQVKTKQKGYVEAITSSFHKSNDEKKTGPDLLEGKTEKVEEWIINKTGPDLLNGETRKVEEWILNKVKNDHEKFRLPDYPFFFRKVMNYNYSRWEGLPSLKHGKHVGMDQVKNPKFYEKMVPTSWAVKLFPPASNDPNFAKKVNDLYNKGYRIPNWVLEDYNTDKFKERAAEALVYADTGSDPKVVSLILKEREPVNIAMKREFDQTEAEKLLKYKVSGYQAYYDEIKILAPNIAVYTHTAVKVSTPPSNDEFRDVHIIHAVGAALDSKEQPDYKSLGSDKEKLRNFYERVFAKIFRCAKDKKLDTVVMSLVGGSNFAKLYTSGQGEGKNVFQEEVWIPTFMDVRSEYPDIKVHFMGLKDGEYAEGFLKEKNYKNLGHFPRCVSKEPRVLYVNAWDPHSIPGNGNGGDDSLDGHVGRSSAVHFLGWGLTNENLVKNIVEVSQSKTKTSKLQKKKKSKK
jgi:hypothetical protein